MHPLTSTLISDFEANKGTEALGATIAEIADLIEKTHGWDHGLDAQEQMAQFAWTERVAQLDRADVSTGDLELLTELLCQFILQAPTDPWVASATWALGKTGQANVKTVLVAALQLQVDGDPNAMYQTMIALQNMGERLFGDHTCLSSLGVEQNRQAALRYLLQN